MRNRLRLLALMAVGLAVATIAALVGSWAERHATTGTALPGPETTSSAPAATEETTPYPDEDPEPTSTTSTTVPTTTRSNGLTIAKRKTVTTPPACTSQVTAAEIKQLTGAAATQETATQEPEQAGFCSFSLTAGGAPAGLVLVALTPTIQSQGVDSQGSEKTTFEGNTAYRATTAVSTCDLRVALTDDSAAKFKALWVTVVLTNASESTCPKVDQLAKKVFDKLPDG